MLDFIQAHWQPIAAAVVAVLYGGYKLYAGGYLSGWSVGGSAAVSVQSDLETLIAILGRAKARPNGTATAAAVGEGVNALVKELTA